MSIEPITPAKDHYELKLDVSATALPYMHNAPGQYVRIGLDDTAKQRHGGMSTILTIASPPPIPGTISYSLSFIIAPGADPLRICRLKAGATLRVSDIMGAGVTYQHLQRGENVHIFADAPQGFALAKSLIECGDFRARTGTGANRTNAVTIYYQMPSPRSLPYAERFSEWSVYGVNVVPVVGTTMVEYLSRAYMGATRIGGMGGVENDFAVGCVARDDTFEALFCSLVLCGFGRTSVVRFSETDVKNGMREVRVESDAYANSTNFTGTSVNGGDGVNGVDEADDRFREQFEHDIWQNWVHVREEMREEFEKKWHAKSRMDRDENVREQEMKNAWASWSAKNKDQWTRVEWDDTAWTRYWDSWGERKNGGEGSGAWGGESAWRTEQKWNSGGQTYWDWVGRGNERKGRSKGYERWNGSGGTAGAWDNVKGGTRWERGGYRYEYEQTEDDKKRHNGSNGYSNRSGSRGTNNGWNGHQNGYGSSRQSYQYSGYKDYTSSGRSRSSSSGGGGSKGWAAIGDVDFYTVLGTQAGASRADIKKAYRKMAMKHHPDRNPDKAEEAHVMMKQIVVAWTVLKDDNQRRKYDLYGVSGI